MTGLMATGSLACSRCHRHHVSLRVSRTLCRGSPPCGEGAEKPTPGPGPEEARLGGQPPASLHLKGASGQRQARAACMTHRAIAQVQDGGPPLRRPWFCALRLKSVTLSAPSGKPLALKVLCRALEPASSA